MGKRIATLLLCSGILGCPYSHGSILYSRNPELKSVTLYAGRQGPAGEPVATLQKYKVGRGDCAALATDALVEMWNDAQALGADGIKDVRFRARWKHTGRVVCRTTISGGKSVQIVGTAYRRSED